VHAAFDGVLASAELNTHIKNATTSSRSHLEVRVHVFRQGAITTADLGVDDIMKTARAFPPAVAGDNGFPYSAQLSDYKGLKSPNDAFGYVDIQNQQDVMADLAKKRFQFLALRDDLAFVLKHSDDFENKDGSDVDHDALSHDFDEVVREINSMQLQLSQCSKDPGKCQFTDFDVSKFLVPRPRKKATGIDVVSLHGLRVWVIRKAALTPHLDLADYTAMVLAEMEPGEVGVIPSEAQYRFILSGVTFTFDRPVPPTAGVGAFRLWIAGQVPNAGDAGTGTPIAITTSTTRPA
jgi:hypothetical protein